MNDTVVSEYVAELCGAIVNQKSKSYEKNLVKLDQLRRDVDHIKGIFTEIDMPRFSHRWDHGDEEEYQLSSSLIWDADDKNILYFFSEDDEPESFLGQNMGIRLDALEHLEDFLNAGLELLTEK